MECSPMARLLFIGMWNFCDDGGNHPLSAKTLKAEVFPADDITIAAVDALATELFDNGLIEPYEVAGKHYWHVSGWHHQKIEKPNFKHPKPPIPQPVGEQSASSRRPVGEHSPPEGKGEEWKGREKGVYPSLALPDSTGVTPAGLVCARLRRDARMADANPQHPKLLALLAAGLSEDEIVAAGEDAVSRGKGFAYALATAEGRRREADNIKTLPAKAAAGSLTKAGQRTAEAAARWLESEGARA